MAGTTPYMQFFLGNISQLWHLECLLGVSIANQAAPSQLHAMAYQRLLCAGMAMLHFAWT